MSYERPIQIDYYHITHTPPVDIGQRTWQKVCETHGEWTARAPNEHCPGCKAKRRKRV